MNIVVPANMRKSVFTTADVDNINEMVRSTLGQNDLNGTFTSHLTADNEGLRRELCKIDPESQSDREKIALPDSYTIVPAIELRNVDIYLAPSDDMCIPESTCVPGALVKDEASLKDTFGLINKETLSKGETCSLVGFNASQIQRETVKPRAE